MLILEHDVLEVILESFMDQLEPAVNGEIHKLATQTWKTKIV